MTLHQDLNALLLVDGAHRSMDKARGLPDELWPLVCEYLTMDDIVSLMRVSEL
jgi:hypothetical protein